MKCVKCNKEINNDAQFCPYCGTKQNDVIVETEQIKKDVLPHESEITHEKKSSPPKGKNGGSKKWLWLLCFILVLVCFTWWYVKDTREVKSFTVNGVSFNMVLVNGGTFTMGDTSDEGDDANNNEVPTHSVTLNTYYIGETEVTQELWQAVMGSIPPGNITTSKSSRKPVENVSWNDCQEFVMRLNSQTGSNFRLPTEAEWEFAARGGNSSRDYMYSGSNSIDEVAWFCNNSNYVRNVAQKLPNELGLYDMSGNVKEWCQDWYGDYSSDSQENPIGPSFGDGRVVRGGGHNFDASSCSVTRRSEVTPDFSIEGLGLRLAL